MNLDTQTAPSVGISFADLLRYNESEAMKWHTWFEAQPSELLDVPFGNAAKRMGNVPEMIWHIFITEWVYACVLNGEPYDGWDQFKRDSVTELFAIKSALIRLLCSGRPIAPRAAGRLGNNGPGLPCSAVSSPCVCFCRCWGSSWRGANVLHWH